ncbi:Hypothetical protein LUCI_1411 [Lucifera butyrica]|uniref:4Fe-4S ferredoxin-type domain-containing protein n=1 Tax=Lucifera butyrica TaxID=1351585 RepID=A0A498R506_9FIRM|nr:4Fe-4S binding protein [Lucifera butyrica]VBB06195.1 Hypothetical protein LUCI_1411 [Lucifera butyrica]
MSNQVGLPNGEQVRSVLPSPERLAKGPVAIFECFQNIPCNPCADACPRGAIKPFTDINDCPKVNDSLCNGCGICLTVCPGLSIVVVDYSYSPDEALLKIPYEFLPLPGAGDKVTALNRTGQAAGTARVLKVQENRNKTAVIWLAVPKESVMEVRHIRPGEVMEA